MDQDFALTKIGIINERIYFLTKLKQEKEKTIEKLQIELDQFKKEKQFWVKEIEKAKVYKGE